jgi:transcription termination factor Rho
MRNFRDDRSRPNHGRGRDFNQNHNRNPYARPHRGPSRPHANNGPRQMSEDERRFFAGTVIDPSPRIRLEDGSKELTMRAMDILCPIGMGQRGLIVAPPGSAKTTFLKPICQAVAIARPEMKIYCLLIDERPEEVTDFRRSVPAEVRWSSSDEAYEHHIATADALMKQVYKEVGEGANVLVVIDSLTRLARVHNAEGRSSGRTLSGGVDARAREVPRRIFGSARKIENGGSLTILATILVDTGSQMEQVIFEEFKGTGNMEMYLSREISNQRIFPAVEICKSATRKEENLFEPEELDQVRKIRRVLSTLNPIEAARGLVTQLQKHATNREFFSALKAQTK